ncbi:MAG TPA: DinB family protein [Gemmatimonadales bacterium]|jgi:uncharacterized damage-inducible protein DinB|nr:DinB family protein [Gemmatimonadales bacterium]
MRAFVVLVLSALTVTQAAAQSEKAGDTNPAVHTSRTVWDIFTKYITTVAEELPESTYAYRPTPEVRSAGQLVGHIANAQYLFCSAALGESAPQKEDIEKTRTRKSELVAALKESTKYCARAYGQTDRTAQQSTKLFGEQRTRLFALGLNAAHNAEHYGNLVTYLRMNGIVPPSSRQAS